MESRLNIFLNDSVNTNIYAFLLTYSGTCMEEKQLKMFRHIVYEFQMSSHTQRNTWEFPDPTPSSTLNFTSLIISFKNEYNEKKNIMSKNWYFFTNSVF